jgi:hypothetical protein
MYYGAWDVFVHSAFFSGLLILLIGLLFVGSIMWAESKVQSEPSKREAWYRQETRKMRVTRTPHN